MTNKPLCIYHGNCADGFGAAWVVRKFYGPDGVDFHAGVYQTPPPDVTGRDVIMVDFSYKYPELVKIADSCNSLLILDHHKTAQPEVAQLMNYVSLCGGRNNVRATIDMSHSGAMLAWHEFFPMQEPPKLLEHIEDRDLWRFALSGTREIQAALFSYEYDFDTWTNLMEGSTNTLFEEGVTLERKHFKDIRELLKITTRRLKIGGHTVLAANLPYTMSSDAGHILAEMDENTFGACYYDGPDGRNFSLRSIDGKADVSEIAKQYGGGGHRNAAGFRVPYDVARMMEIDNG